MRAPALASRAARLRRAIASVGSVRNAMPINSPAATRTISSHRGSPAEASGFGSAWRAGRRALAFVAGRLEAGCGAGAGADACGGTGAFFAGTVGVGRGARDPDGAP